ERPGEPRRRLADAGRGRKDLAEAREQREVVLDRKRMRHDQVWHLRGQPLDRRLVVLVDVDDQVRRREPANPLDVDVLGAADLRYRTQAVAWMNAEPGTPDQLIPQPQRAQQLGQAGHQRDDSHAHRGAPSGSPDPSAASRRLRGARANSASKSGFRSARSASATTRIGHGMTTNDRPRAIASTARRANTSASVRKGIGYRLRAVIGVRT